MIDEGFSLEGTEELTFRCGTSLAEMYKLSPYVWSSSEGYQLLLRVVNVDPDPAKKVARIHAGRSRDGVLFELDDIPVVSPSRDPAEPDSGGCEDPTVDDPVVTPGRRRSTEDTDIAFAASAVVENGRVILYYSVADRYCIRASLRSRDLIA